jgi:hypothetical protein
MIEGMCGRLDVEHMGGWDLETKKIDLFLSAFPLIVRFGWFVQGVIIR